MVNLRELRKKHKLTQIELSKKSGVSPQSISMIETGYRSASVKAAKALAPYIGVKWTKFFDDKGA